VDPDSRDDVTRAHFYLDLQPPISSGGETAAHVQPENILFLKDGGFCWPGQASFLSANYIRLGCAHATVCGDGDTVHQLERAPGAVFRWELWMEQGL
jgi:hypothetical protein